MTAIIDEILRLPVEERLEIVDRIWDSLEENIPVTEYEITVAKERYEEYQKNPDNSLDWKEVKNQLFQKYGLGNKD